MIIITSQSDEHSLDGNAFFEFCVRGLYDLFLVNMKALQGQQYHTGNDEPEVGLC